MTRTTLLSPRPWSWRPYVDDSPCIGLSDARDNELAFTWVAAESRGKERLPYPAGFVQRPRAEHERNLTAICAAVNGEPFDGEPATPRPWRVIPGRGWKDEPVLSVVGPAGHNDEVVCWQRDHQTEIDFAAIVDAVNARWP